ncbi:MAG: hypothetical protein AAF383_13030 [Cyanobacteria bacterium P01_A01_bin.83]
MPLEIIIPIAAALILLILFTWIINVFKVTFKTVLILVAIFVLLQIVFGVNSQDIIQEMLSIIERIKQLINAGLD